MKRPTNQKKTDPTRLADQDWWAAEARKGGEANIERINADVK